MVFIKHHPRGNSIIEAISMPIEVNIYVIISNKQI